MSGVRRYTYTVDPVYDRESLTPIDRAPERFAPTGQYVSGFDHDAAVNALRDELGAVKGEYDRAVNKVEALQQHVTAADERVAAATPSKVSKCRACGGTSLTWFAQNTVKNGIQQNRLNTNDVTCMFVLGCDDCSETLALVSADKIAGSLPVAALKPADGGGDE